MCLQLHSGMDTNSFSMQKVPGLDTPEFLILSKFTILLLQWAQQQQHQQWNTNSSNIINNIIINNSKDNSNITSKKKVSNSTHTYNKNISLMFNQQEKNITKSNNTSLNDCNIKSRNITYLISLKTKVTSLSSTITIIKI